MFVGRTLCGGKIYRADAIQYQYPIIHSVDIRQTFIIHIAYFALDRKHKSVS